MENIHLYYSTIFEKFSVCRRGCVFEFIRVKVGTKVRLYKFIMLENLGTYNGNVNKDVYTNNSIFIL